MRRLARIAALVALQACAESRPADEAAGDPRFAFMGTSALSESELRRIAAPDLARYLQEPRPAPLQDAVFRMTSAYALAGHPEAAVDVEELDGTVRFLVREGPYFALGRLHFSGNRALRERELEGIEPGALPGRRIPFSDRLLARMKADLLSIYRQKGFVDVEVRTTTSAEREADVYRMNVTFHIVEGRAYTVEAVEGVPEEAREAVEDLRGRPFTPGTENLVEARVIDRYRERGRPFVTARAEARPDAATGQVRVLVQVDPGERARLGEVEVKGERRTRSGFVRARSGLEPGAEYRASELAEAERRLLSTGLFQSVRLETGPVDAEGRAPVLAFLEEREPGEVALRLGYGTLDGERIGLDVSYDNILGGAELLRVGGTYGRYGQRVDGEAALRYLYGTDVRPGVSGFYEVRDYPSFQAASYGGDVSISYDFGHGLHASTGLLHSVIRTSDVEEGVPPGDLLDYEYTALFWTAGWDLRDVPHLPTRGLFMGLRVEWSDRPLETELRFINVNARTAAYLPLGGAVVAAVGLQGGRIAPLGDTQEIPIALRYFAGGLSTVRGFEFASIGPEVDGEPTGGEVYASLQAELRFPIWGGLHGAVFSDRGGVWFEQDDVDLDELRWSVGLGARYYTPAGALVVDLGWNPDKEEDEEAVEAHLSIGFPF
jgi:outer membrane protein assembly complex protein YaeT